MMFWRIRIFPDVLAQTLLNKSKWYRTHRTVSFRHWDLSRERGFALPWVVGGFRQKTQGEEAFVAHPDTLLQQKNIYYKDLIAGKILQPRKITRLQKEAFNHYMKLQGTLGDQNKVPRLSNEEDCGCAGGVEGEVVFYFGWWCVKLFCRQASATWELLSFSLHRNSF